MFRTPLKNSKNVNKPFKSPFESPAQKKDVVDANKTVVKQNCTAVSSPLSTRHLEAKRVLLMDEDEQDKKRSKLSLDKVEQVKVEVPDNVTKSDLLNLKRSIFEVRQELDRLKSRERCTKKNNPQDLKVSISTWKSACQSALETVCSELTERNGKSVKISEVLNMLSVPHNIVGYSEKDDSFT